MYRVVDKGKENGYRVYEVDTEMFPYYVNHGMEFLRVQEQSGTVRSFWQKEDGTELFAQQWTPQGHVMIRMNGDGITYRGTVEVGDGCREPYIKWDGDHPDERVYNCDPSFVGKTYRVYVSADSIKTICYDGEYDSNKKYVYTEWDEKGKLKSRGLISGNLLGVYPFKEFNGGEMTEYEYDYDVKNGAIAKERKEIHHGKFVNSIKRGYPRRDNSQKVPSSGPNGGGSQERLPSADATGTNESIPPVNLRTNPDGSNRGEESPIYYSYTNQENGAGEKVDEGKKEGGNGSHASDNTTVSVTDRYSSITTIDDIGVNCEHIHLLQCPDYRGNLDFSEFSSLVSVVIDDDSLNRVTLITFNWMKNLKSITVGARSFTAATGLSIANCDKLESLTIGPQSFRKATSFIVMNCDNLKTITVGNDIEFSDNFMKCDELILSGLAGLESILFGMYSFNKTKKAVFTNLWNLRTITVGLNTCQGVAGSSLKMTSTFCCCCVMSRSSSCSVNQLPILRLHDWVWDWYYYE